MGHGLDGSHGFSRIRGNEQDGQDFQDCWQLCDFMKRVGLEYPLDDTGKVLGETYEFIIPGEDSNG